jgi:hypothetical protein
MNSGCCHDHGRDDDDVLYNSEMKPTGTTIPNPLSSR